MMLRITYISFLMAVATSGFAQAPGNVGTVSDASYGLLDDPAVRKEIKLTPTQDAFIKGEFKRVNESVRQIMSKRPTNEAEMKAAQSKMGSLQLNFYAGLKKKLTPPQAKRLRELGLQFFGPFSMLSPEIQKELGMTSAQVNKVKAAQKSLFDKTKELQSMRRDQVRTIPPPKDRNDQKAVKEYVAKVQAMMAKFGPGDGKTIAGYKKSAEAQALNALSAAQKGKWQAMKGVKFTPPRGK